MTTRYAAVIVCVIMIGPWFSNPLNRTPTTITEFDQEPFTAAQSLGRNLFFEKRLSLDETISCATCHDPASAFADHKSIATGIRGRVGTRNVPTLLNVAFGQSFFLDGRVESLEEQATQPLLSQSEMGMPSYEAIVARVEEVPEYSHRFKRVFPRDGLTIGTIAKAIASYERTLVSRNAPFDRFLSGDDQAMSEAQKRGWELFRGKGRCIACHEFKPDSPLFTDRKFHNTGTGAKELDFAVLISRARNALKDRGLSRDKAASFLARTEGLSELGRYNVSGESRDIGAFKTPTLRDVELTSPYMHNGSIKTLTDVVRFYNRGCEANPYLDSEIRPLGLTDEEMGDLVQFLRALTSDDVLKQAQTLKPQNRLRERYNSNGQKMR